MSNLMDLTTASYENEPGKPGKNRNRYVSLLVFILGILIGIFVVGLFPHSENRTGKSGMSPVIGAGNTAKAQSAESSTMLEYEKAVINATKKSMPAVVSVQVTGTQVVVQRLRDPFFDMLYGRQLARQKVTGTGSGVIIDPKGLIITNDHVINRGENVKVSIRVVLPDGRIFDARVLKNFPNQDIAILSVDGNNLPYLELGASSDLTPGQTVLAIGNPFGDRLTGGLLGGDPTVTRGIISATRRNLTLSDGNLVRYYRNMLQTDAAINEGNSGGALVDLDGQLVGVNTAIFQEGGGSLGIGFAIPADRVRLVLDHFKKHGDVGKVYTGLSGADVTKEIAESLDFKGAGGTMIQTVEKGSPGDEAGFKRGDIITKINGFTVSNAEEVNSMFYGSVPGEIFIMTVFRKGQYTDLELELGSK